MSWLKKALEQEKQIEILKNISETIALFFAAGYFIYQMSGGNDISNMSLDLSSKTINHNDSLEYNLLSLKLTNGDKAAIGIKSITARITSYPSDHSYVQIINFVGYKRTDSTLYIMGTEESTIFSALYSKKRGQIDKIQVIVVGERSRFYFVKVNALWQASTFSENSGVEDKKTQVSSKQVIRTL